MATHSERPLAFVTGASSGIGFELAKQFAQHDFELIIAAADRAVQTAAQERGGAGAWRTDSAKAEMHRKLAEPASAES